MVVFIAQNEAVKMTNDIVEPRLALPAGRDRTIVDRPQGAASTLELLVDCEAWSSGWLRRLHRGGIGLGPGPRNQPSLWLPRPSPPSGFWASVSRP
jgi:hypothetical protein